MYLVVFDQDPRHLSKHRRASLNKMETGAPLRVSQTWLLLQLELQQQLHTQKIQ